MKRPIAKTLIIVAALVASGCGQPISPTATDAPAQDGWVMSPTIDAVTSLGSSLSISGQAAPLGRVVISGPGGQAYAVGADDQGRFDLRVPRPGRDTLFLVEARAGQLSYPAPYRLLLAAEPSGPVGLLSLGAPTRRLDPGGGLDAHDSDGTAAFLSGRATPGVAVAVVAGEARMVTAGPDGRWAVALPDAGLGLVSVGALSYAPPVGPAPDGSLERSGAGWRISWSGPGGARQTTWFPDRRQVETFR